MVRANNVDNVVMVIIVTTTGKVKIESNKSQIKMIFDAIKNNDWFDLVDGLLIPTSTIKKVYIK